MKRSLAVVVLPALLLSACGGDDADDGDQADQPDASDDDGSSDAADTDTFAAELEDGTTLTVRLAVAESDPVVAPFVAFRADAGATDPVVWVVGSLEAPSDFDDPLGPPTGRFLTFVPPGGDVIGDDEGNPTTIFACSRLDEWFGTPTGDEANALNDRYLEVINGPCEGQTLQVVGEPGTTTDYAMVFEGATLPDFDALYAGLLTELQPVG